MAGEAGLLYAEPGRQPRCSGTRGRQNRTPRAEEFCLFFHFSLALCPLPALLLTSSSFDEQLALLHNNMNPQTSWRWLRQWTGVGLPLLAFLLAAPTSARASCGDYLDLGNAHATAHAPAADSGTTPTPADPQPRPCSGPLCSRSLPLPLSPAGTPPAPVDDWSCPPLPLFLDAPQAVARLLDPTCPDLSSSSSAVYHPPRTSPF
jgi:hypothetical protein